MHEINPRAKWIKITGCTDPMMWYRDLIGCIFPVIYLTSDGYMSREPAGYLNIVKFEDSADVSTEVRYNWIRDHALGIDSVADPDNLIQVWFDTVQPMSAYGRTLDEAIDNAMQISKKGLP